MLRAFLNVLPDYIDTMKTTTSTRVKAVQKFSLVEAAAAVAVEWDQNEAKQLLA